MMIFTLFSIFLFKKLKKLIYSIDFFNNSIIIINERC